jgi:hypothetical protein
MLTIAPPPASSSAGISYLSERKTPSRLIARALRNCSGAHLGERRGGVAAAGSVVDGGVEAAELFYRGRNHALNRRGVGDVSRNGQGTAALVLDLRRHLGEGFGVAGGEHGGGPFAGHNPGDLSADPAARSGHDHAAPFQHSLRVSHVLPPPKNAHNFDVTLFI